MLVVRDVDEFFACEVRICESVGLTHPCAIVTRIDEDLYEVSMPLSGTSVYSEEMLKNGGM